MGLASAGDGNQRRDLKCNCRPEQRGDLRAIVGGRYLNHVTPDKLETSEGAHHIERFKACQSTNYRGAGSRGESRIDAIDIKRQIAGTCSGNPAQFLKKLPLYPRIVKPLDIEHVDPSVLSIVEVIGGGDPASDAYLKDVIAPHQPFIDRPAHGCAVVVPLSGRPVGGVGMGVKLNEREASMSPARRAQYRK